MTIDLTQIILAIITLIFGLITRYVVPWIRGKVNDQQSEVLSALVRVGVYAAEQLFTSEQWKEKKQYVVDLLKENGYEIDSTAVDALIEATVRELRIEQGQVPPKQEVAHAAADKIRFVSEAGEAIQHAKRVRIDVLAGNAVIRPRADHGAECLSHFSSKDAEHEIAILCQKRPAESSHHLSMAHFATGRQIGRGDKAKNRRRVTTARRARGVRGWRTRGADRRRRRAASSPQDRSRRRGDRGRARDRARAGSRCAPCRRCRGCAS